jgi:hypothetical protein
MFVYDFYLIFDDYREEVVGKLAISYKRIKLFIKMLN